MNNALFEMITADRRSRRSAMKNMLAAAAGIGASAALTTTATAQSATVTDVDVLNFALNLEYLEAEFYLYATTGAGLEAQGVDVSGSGTAGPVTIKTNPRVRFASPILRQYAEEIAADELAHVRFIRAALIGAGATPVARPALDLRASFTALARATGLVGPTGTFDAFGSELNFVIAAYVFEDVGVTAYKGGAPLISNKGYLEAAAGIMAAEAYHAGVIRNLLIQSGATGRNAANAISNVRDAVDGTSDLDQGVFVNNRSNLVPTDENGLCFSRSTRDVLNIVYLTGDSTANRGGFFPTGMNGLIR
jgi:hypothetical protein